MLKIRMVFKRLNFFEFLHELFVNTLPLIQKKNFLSLYVLFFNKTQVHKQPSARPPKIKNS